MKGTKRSAGLVAAAAGLMIMGAASVAWACTQQAFIGSISPGSGPAGSRATVTASRFNPGPVQIRWNGTDGPLLATASGPNLSVGITIPDARPDLYTVVAVQRRNDVIVGKASVSFEVTPATATSRGGYSSSNSGTTADGGQDASGSVSRSSSGSTASPDAGETSSSGSATSGNSGAAFPSEASADAAPSQAAAATARQTPTERVSSTATPAGQVVTGAPSRAVSGTGTPGERGHTAQALPAAAGETKDVVPSPRSATADLWAGFADGQPARGVSLADAPDSTGSTSPLALGAGVLSGGLVALFAGFGVAEHRRRRVLAATTAERGRA